MGRSNDWNASPAPGTDCPSIQSTPCSTTTGGAASAGGSRPPVPAATDPATRQWRSGSLPGALARARAHPEWAQGEGDEDKDEAIAELAETLA